MDKLTANLMRHQNLTYEEVKRYKELGYRIYKCPECGKQVLDSEFRCVCGCNPTLEFWGFEELMGPEHEIIID